MTFGVSKFCLATIASLLLSFACMPAMGAGRSELDKLCMKFSGFNQNKDNQIEIASLRPVFQSPKSTGARVMMLVEARLLETGKGERDLRPYLERWANDLDSEGCRTEVVSVSLAKGPKHQDGRYILAIRDFLRAANAQSRLSGVVLVGHFPDASIVRSTNWRKGGDVVLHKKSSQPQTYKEARLISRHPSLVAAKADIVLADLGGNWEKVYIQQKTPLTTTTAVFDKKPPAEGGPCIDFEQSTRAFEDVFHVEDGALTVRKQPPQRDGRTPAVVTLDNSVRNLECSAEDGKLPNGIAMPDIAVSRIDARGIALSPRANIVGLNGAKLLDKSGVPQTVKFASKRAVPNWSDGIWAADEKLERKLLTEYFDRNHAYRKGTTKVAWRPASIAHELGSGYRVMLRASKKWENSDASLRDIKKNTTLVDFINWMEYPAVLRTVRAHSFSSGSQFEKVDYKKIEERVDGPIWSWTQRGDKLVPSLQAASGGGMLNWFLLRTLYENGRVAKTPSFYHHTGCNSISPPGVGDYAYDHSRYGVRQGAEALLFFGNGLALVGRAKVYFDEPGGFAEELAKGRTYGQAWAKNFDLDSQNPKIHDVSRKKAYFWSLLGDWTLRLSTAEPGREMARANR